MSSDTGSSIPTDPIPNNEIVPNETTLSDIIVNPDALIIP
jgi:hypothetical protein